MPELQGERARCPRCGSDDPKKCGRGIRQHDHGLHKHGNPTRCCKDPFHAPAPTEGEAGGARSEALPDPYICQQCAAVFPVLDLMGQPQCECGSEQFWPLPQDQTLFAILHAAQAPAQSGEAERLREALSKSANSLWRACGLFDGLAKGAKAQHGEGEGYRLLQELADEFHDAAHDAHAALTPPPREEGAPVCPTCGSDNPAICWKGDFTDPATGESAGPHRHEDTLNCCPDPFHNPVPPPPEREGPK